MSPRENTLKAIRFQHPDYIPMTFKINASCWNAYPNTFLFELMESHPLLFPDYQRPVSYTPDYLPNARKDTPFQDDWGCLWQTSTDGITGTVTSHPLYDWDNFASYSAPNPQLCTGIGSINWSLEKQKICALQKIDQLTKAGLRHGHTFLQLCDIRGYENLIYDMADESPFLPPLIEMVEVFNLCILRQYLDMGVDIITIPEDLGMQIGPMLSPEHFSRYILPSYKRLTKAAAPYNSLIHMHSDGDIRQLLPDLLSLNMDILNLQDLVNGIDWIATHLKGRLCIELDVDRQAVTSYGTPAQINQLIREEVEKLGSKEGGLMLLYGLYPGIPKENVIAVMDAMEEYAFYYS